MDMFASEYSPDARMSASAADDKSIVTLHYYAVAKKRLSCRRYCIN